MKAYLLAFLLIFGALSCKQSPPATDPDHSPPADTTTISQPEKKSITSPEPEATPEDEYNPYDRKYEKSWFVIAPSGLNLRKNASLNAEVLTVVPYGAELAIKEFPEKEDMVIEGYHGGMAKIAYEGKTGYLFDGFLSRFPPPKGKMSVQQYVDHIIQSGKVAIFHNERYDDGGYIQDTEGLIVPTDDFEEAFLIAKTYFKLPEGISLPDKLVEGDNIVKNPDANPNMWSDELSIVLDKEGKIKEIYYYLRGEGGGQTISIEPDKRGMKIAETLIAD